MTHIRQTTESRDHDVRALLECLYRMLDAADRKDWAAARKQFSETVLLVHDSAAGHPQRIASSDVIASWERFPALRRDLALGDESDRRD